MSYLFQIQDKVVYPNPETLLVEPFKTIWERDTTKNKAIAIQEFSYIEFMTSMLKSNPFRDYHEDIKDEKVRENVIKEENWEPDELVFEAMEMINKLQTEGSTSYQYWMANKKAAEKIIDFFNNFDMDERNPKSFVPIYKPADITRAIRDAEDTLTKLDSLKKKVEEELFESSRNRGDKEVSPFAKL